jgi:hypothetical protein
MNDFKKRMLVAAVIAGLGMIGYLMNSQQAVAQGPPDGLAVRIVNPVPVPVTGSTTVSGTIAATQSGTWNVGITGTPHVNVTNPATAPVLFLNVNDPGRIPYQSQLLSTCPADECILTFPVVPTNHRLVIQHFSGEITFSGAPSPLGTILRGLGGPQSASMVTTSLPATSVFHATTLFDHLVLLSYDAGRQPLAVLSAPSIQFADITLIGYMLDCTIAPCAAIAQ